MNRKWQRALTDIVAWIMPSPCVSCGRPTYSGLCEECEGRLEPVPRPFCALCGREIPAHIEPGVNCRDCRGVKIHFDRARSLFRYSGVASDIVRTTKYQKIWSMTGLMSQNMADYLIRGEVSHGIALSRIDAVVPVALHPKTLRKRGFNQSELMARKLAKSMGWNCREWLSKIRETAPQAGLGSEERRKNVKNSFRAAENECLGARILLIDDVFTTGATANECARALKSAGAREVFVLSFARGGFDDQGL